jgi:hypothetical protein
LEKLLLKILSGRSDAGIEFTELCGLMRRLGFSERIRGDHHIFTRSGVEEIINVQPRDSLCKPYQIRQVRTLITHYKVENTDAEI